MDRDDQRVGDVSDPPVGKCVECGRFSQLSVACKSPTVNDAISYSSAMVILERAALLLSAQPPQPAASLELTAPLLDREVTADTPRLAAMGRSLILATYADALKDLGREREACDLYVAALDIYFLKAVAEVYADTVASQSVVDHYTRALAALRRRTIWDRPYSILLRGVAYAWFRLKYRQHPQVIAQYHQLRDRKRMTLETLVAKCHDASIKNTAG